MAKQLDISTGQFTTDSGKTYKLATSLTMGRYIKFDELEKRMYFNRNASEMFADIRRVYDHLDKNEQNEPRIILHNMMSAIKDDASKKYPTSFLMCTLFLYEDGEDLNTWSEDDANRKVADWIASGYEAADFFRLAANLCRAYISDLKKALDTGRNPVKVEAADSESEDEMM